MLAVLQLDVTENWLCQHNYGAELYDLEML